MGLGLDGTTVLAFLAFFVIFYFFAFFVFWFFSIFSIFGGTLTLLAELETQGIGNEIGHIVSLMLVDFIFFLEI